MPGQHGIQCSCNKPALATCAALTLCLQVDELTEQTRQIAGLQVLADEIKFDLVGAGCQGISDFWAQRGSCGWTPHAISPCGGRAQACAASGWLGCAWRMQ